MRDEEFSVFAKLLRERSGLVLTRDKEYLIESRLLPIAQKHGRPSLADLARDLAAPSIGLERDVLEAMTTNETLFFRDAAIFDRFRKDVLPAIRNARAAEKQVRIWSAACSSGQEPYSLAMLIAEDCALGPNWQLDICATDLATKMIERAEAGIYNHFEVQRGLPIKFLTRYFAKADEAWRIDPKIRAMVRFAQLNLLKPFAALGMFDVIFCRNVLIYFDIATKRDILDRMSRQLRPDGFLILGSAETVIGVTNGLVPLPGRPGVYVHSPIAASARIAV